MAPHPTIYRSATTGNVRLEELTPRHRRITEEGSSACRMVLLSWSGVVVTLAVGELLSWRLPFAWSRNQQRVNVKFESLIYQTTFIILSHTGFVHLLST